MRVNVEYEEEHPGQHALWQANCRRSLRGRRGRDILERLEKSLLSMPVKELHVDVLVSSEGAVCGIGALLVEEEIEKGTSREDAVSKFSDFDPCETELIAIALFNMSRMVVWSLIVENDEKHYVYPIGEKRRLETPAERYVRVLEWVQKELRLAFFERWIKGLV